MNREHVQWRWVHAHSTEPGNSEADDLAKRGISSKDCFWQNFICAERENNSVFAESSDKPTKKTDKYEPKDNSQTHPKLIETKEELKESEELCCACQQPVIEAGINCTECKKWIHYQCTELPAYQLYLYESTTRKFTCSLCSNIDTLFLEEFNELTQSAKQECNETKHQQTQTEVNHEDQIIQCNITTNKETVVQTTEKTQVEVKDNTLEAVENSYIKIIDKLLQERNSLEDNH